MGSPSHPVELREKIASHQAVDLVVSGNAFFLRSTSSVQRAKEHFADGVLA